MTALELSPALERADLLAPVVAAALQRLPAHLSQQIQVTPIDPDLADTATFCETYGISLAASAWPSPIRRRSEALRSSSAPASESVDQALADLTGATGRPVDVTDPPSLQAFFAETGALITWCTPPGTIWPEC